MGTYWHRSNSFEFDDNGDRAPGAKIYFFDAGTSTPRAVYQDAGLSVAHAHPTVADGNGRWPQIFLQFGSYKEVATTSGGTQLWETDDIPNPEPFDEAFEVDETAQLNTGDTWFSFQDDTREGAVRCNGKTLGSAASGGTERANADCSDLFTFLWNKLNNTSAPVSGGRGASAAADFAANKTITLPDLRGANPIGLTTMGNTDNGILSAVPITTGNSSIPGSTLGAVTHTLLLEETPGHTHSVSGTAASDGAHTHALTAASAASNGAHTHTINITDPGHTHTQATGGPSGTKANEADTGTAGAGYVNAAAASTLSNTTGITAASVSNGAHTHTLSGSTDSGGAHTHSVSGTAATAGGSGSHNNVSKVLTGTWYMKL